MTFKSFIEGGNGSPGIIGLLSTVVVPVIFALAFLAAFFTALFAIRWLLDFVRRRSFATFGFYRLALVLAFLLYLAAF